MSGPFGSSQWMYASGGFYNGVATQSLRLDDGSSAYLSKSFATSNRKTGTYSIWIKRSNLSLSTGANILSGGDATTNDYFWGFTNTDTLQIRNITNNSYNLEVFTQRVFRDTSAWYNIVVVQDTTQSTTNDRLKIYINGIQDTNLTYTTMPSQNADTSLNLSGTHYISKLSYANQAYIDGYIAEVNFIDGTAYDASYFGEFKNGVWIPKEPSVTYGTNGFRLQFNQTGTGTASSSTIGADTSGNNNHFSSSGIDTEDCDMPDSPENNMCTMNPLLRGGYGLETIFFNEGNLRLISGNNGYGTGAGSTHGVTMSQQVYAEVKLYSGFLGRFGQNFGLADPQRAGTFSSSGSGVSGSGINAMMDALGRVWKDGVLQTTVSAPTSGDIIGIAFDGVNSQVIWTKNGSAWYTLTGISSSTYVYTGFTSDQAIQVWNFGQDSTFIGTETAGGNADANGIGDFAYAPPTDFLALCTSNLPEPTISPNANTQADDYFSTTLYTSNNIGAGGTQSVTGVGFQADWAWIKNRSSSGTSHTLFDSVRTAGKMLQSDNDSLEASNSQYGYLSSFDSDGFTLTGGTTNANFINQGTDAYVSWNWKAGGTAVSNTDGTITSSVSANTDAGFSIVSYTSNNSAGATVGHGLGVAPQMVIIKKRSAAERWFVWHTGDSTEYMYLNDTFAGQANLDDRFGNNTTVTLPSSTVLTLGTNNDVNGTSGSTYIAYCFAEIESYSKFGSYTGNGSATDGTYVFCGFSVSWVMVKRTNSIGSWAIYDNKRNAFNARSKRLVANVSDAEADTSTQAVDFLSNGFKLKSNNTDQNGSGDTYIYMAFATNPFKYSTGV